jgi:hypothetical protein
LKFESTFNFLKVREFTESVNLFWVHTVLFIESVPILMIVRIFSKRQQVCPIFTLVQHGVRLGSWSFEGLDPSERHSAQSGKFSPVQPITSCLLRHPCSFRPRPPLAVRLLLRRSGKRMPAASQRLHTERVLSPDTRWQCRTIQPYRLFWGAGLLCIYVLDGFRSSLLFNSCSQSLLSFP